MTNQPPPFYSVPPPKRNLFVQSWAIISQRQRWAAYLLALILPWATLLLDVMIGLTRDAPPMTILFVPVIILCASIGGLGPGLVTTLLSVLLTGYFLLPSVYQFTVAAPIQFVQWGVLCFSGILISILSQVFHRAQHAADTSQQTQELLAAIVESSGDAIIGKDLHGIVTSWNASAERMFGYTASEIIGKPITMIIPPERHSDEDHILQRITHGEHIEHFETVRQCKDGSFIDVSLSISPIVDHNQHIIGASKVARNITERKRSAAELERTVKHLRVLSEASRSFAEVGAEYENLLQHIAQTITEVLGDSCSIRLHSPNDITLPIVAQYTIDPQKQELSDRVLNERPIPIDHSSLPGRVFLSGQPLLIPILDREQTRATATPEYWSLVDQLGIHSIVAAPMRVQSQTIGVLIVSRFQPDRPAFDQADLRLVQDLADQAALAISNARLFQQVQHELSERERAESALSLSEQRYRQIVETAQEGIWLIDESNKTTFVNPKMAAMLGYTIEEMIGTSLFDFMDAEEQAIALANVEHRRQDIEEQHDFKFRHKAGNAVWALISTNPIQDANEGYRGSLALITDITERKHSEEQLQYQAGLLENVSDAIISTDTNYVIRSWNAAAERLYGWQSNEVIGHRLSDILPTTYLHSTIQEVMATFNHHRRWQGEVIQPHRDGTNRMVLSSVSRLSDSAGQPTGTVGVNHDITKRKQAEVALQRYAERLQHLRAIDQAILTSRTLSEIAQAALGHIDNLIPCSYVALILIDASAQTMTLFAQFVHDQVCTSPQLQMPMARLGDLLDLPGNGHIYQIGDASTLPELAAFLHTINADQLQTLCMMPILIEGDLMALLHVGSDTAQNFAPEHIDIVREVADQLSIALQQARLREQIEQHAIDLEQRVAIRTAELTASNKELEAFSYSVSHDLRAPLRAIDGFSRILLEDYVAGLPDEAQNYLHIVRDNAQQMGRLIDDLLAFARLSRQPLTKQPTDPTSIVHQCLSELHDEQNGRQIEIQIAHLPTCRADPALLKQVWINLLANALKYTRKRQHAIIEVGSFMRPADQNKQPQVVYFIKDNGVGFDMRYSNKLFGVFQRLHRVEDYEGTGVGLAIVQRIIHRHGGHIWAEAQIDQGATFSFTMEEEHS